MSEAGKSEKRDEGASVREQVQVDLILSSVDGAAAHPPDWRETGGAQYLYRRDTIIVRDSNLERVRAVLTERNVSNDVDPDLPLAGATRLKVSKAGDWSLPDEIVEIEAREGPGAAGLDHLFYVCVHSCAADEPEPVATAAPPVPRPQTGPHATAHASRHGAGVHVRVLDTGLVAGAAESHDWMTGVTGDVDNPSGRNGLIRQDGGHGTFTAGCVRVTAPEARVHVVNATAVLPRVTDSDEIGAVFESELANLLRSQLVADQGQPPIRVPDILVLNFAGTTQSDRPPVALATLYDSVIQHLKELLIVAPAGNEGKKWKNWPAAFSWVVSVGALDEDWRHRASWSNHGRSVDVYAPGDRLVNAFATGDYVPTWDGQPNNPPVHFDGMARWSGTSFATPLVAGLVAARMSTTQQRSRRAWESLLDLAERQALPGVGPVLYPGQELA